LGIFYIFRTAITSIEDKNQQSSQQVDTTTWKTYRNEVSSLRYKFEIMYPPNWPIDFSGDVLTVGDQTINPIDRFTQCYVNITIKTGNEEGSIIPAPHKLNYYSQINEGEKCEETLKRIISSFKRIQ